jgi:hypothetical protein
MNVLSHDSLGYIGLLVTFLPQTAKPGKKYMNVLRHQTTKDNGS